MKLLICLLIAPLFSFSQGVLPNANTIIVGHVNFMRVCNALLDSGYVIEKKDNDLMTVTTGNKQYPNRWNAVYSIYIRVKDSTAYISGTFTAPPGGGLFKNEPIKNYCNKKGETKAGSIGGYPFIIIDKFAHSLGSDINYAKL